MTLLELLKQQPEPEPTEFDPYDFKGKRKSYTIELITDEPLRIENGKTQCLVYVHPDEYPEGHSVEKRLLELSKSDISAINEHTWYRITHDTDLGKNKNDLSEMFTFWVHYTKGSEAIWDWECMP